MIADEKNDISQIDFAYDQRFLMYTAFGESVNMENHFLGEPVILICGGPSLRDVDFGEVCESGIITMGLNNSWNTYRPDLWCGVDRADSFSDRGWADPRIIKFAPVSEMRRNLRRRESGKFTTLGKTPGRSPNTLFFKRSVGFQPETFLHQPTANYGNNGGHFDSTGVKGSRSVMLAAMRILHYLGFRRVYIVGADFNMPLDGDHYANGERQDDATARGNDGTYDALNIRFDKLRPIFDDAGFAVKNCTPNSRLSAFEFDDLPSVIADENKQKVDGHDTIGWYEHAEEK